MNVLALVGPIPVELAYVVVFAAALAKSSALPVPGTTTLITAVVVAGREDVGLSPIVLAAFAGAVLGGHVGYVVGRRGGRWVLTRDGRWHEKRRRWLSHGEAFWRRHGTKTVLVARLFPVLRHVGGLLAGIHRMELSRFAVVNAAGALLWVAWGTTIALVVGETAGGAVGTLGAVVLALALAGAIGAVTARRVLRGIG